jgi:hypothetical protein
MDCNDLSREIVTPEKLHKILIKDGYVANHEQDRKRGFNMLVYIKDTEFGRLIVAEFDMTKSNYDNNYYRWVNTILNSYREGYSVEATLSERWAMQKEAL